MRLEQSIPTNPTSTPLQSLTRSLRKHMATEASPATVTPRVEHDPLNPVGPKQAHHADNDRATSVASRIGDSIELHMDDGLSGAEQQVVEKLKARDRAVRARADAQRAAAGEFYRGGPVYQFVTGPDGKQYAMDAQIQLENGPGRTPKETIRRANAAARAALAPPSPSDTDRLAAARAQLIASEAQRTIADEGEADKAPPPISPAPSAAKGHLDVRG